MKANLELLFNHGLTFNHGFHGLKGFPEMDLAAKAADFTEPNPRQSATKLPNPRQSATKLPNPRKDNPYNPCNPRFINYHQRSFYHGFHGLKGFPEMDLAAKAADFTEPYPCQSATKLPNPRQSATKLPNPRQSATKLPNPQKENPYNPRHPWFIE